MSKKFQAIGNELKRNAQVLFSLVALLWVITIIDQVIFHGKMRQLGIAPKDPDGLKGILFAPFLHGDFYHLAANTVPLLVLGWFVMIRSLKDFWWVSLISAVVGGLGTWLIGSPYSVHIGASGVIFGYFGYLLFRGYFERSAVAVGLSIAIAMSYGGLIFGVLPTAGPRISWEGHLFGFIGGIIAAKLLANDRKHGG
ncbi:MAG: rhomboid family intramembrane serine protease [Pseudanabaenaceae cyanobacterium]|jgi:membrane associated rhomboid family serine protease